MSKTWMYALVLISQAFGIIVLRFLFGDSLLRYLAVSVLFLAAVIAWMRISELKR